VRRAVRELLARRACARSPSQWAQVPSREVGWPQLQRKRSEVAGVLIS